MAKKTAPSSAASAVKTAPKRAAASVKKVRQAATQLSLAVPTALVGGFRVYGSPVRPVHFTQKQIADAVDALE